MIPFLCTWIKHFFPHLSSKTYPALHMAKQTLSEEQTMNDLSVLVLDQIPQKLQPPAPSNETTNQTRERYKKREKRLKKKQLSSC